MTITVTVTPTAETFMRRMVRMNGGPPGSGFRLTVTEGGCSGMASHFSVEAAPQPDDADLDVNGLRLFLSKSSCALLEGAIIDLDDGPHASGLRIVNPNLSDCSCGSTSPGRGGRHATVDISTIRREYRMKQSAEEAGP